MSGDRRRIELVVARTPARLLALAAALVALGSLVLVGCLWQWARAGGAPIPVLWLLATSAAAYFVGGVLAMVAWGMVKP